MDTAQRTASGKDIFIDRSQRAIQLLFPEDGNVAAHFAQSRQSVLQQREPVQCNSGFVLAHACALAACKDKAGQLGVDHRDDSSLRRLKIEKTGTWSSQRKYSCLPLLSSSPWRE